MIKGEVDLITKRIRRKLPPGYLGFPIHREIKVIRTITSGGIQQAFSDARRNYGTFFAQHFLGTVSIVLGGQYDLMWLFNNDRKALTAIAWPPNIAMLLGPGGVANQSGKYRRALRRLMEPYFAPKFVTNYLSSMDGTTMEELDSWSSSGEFQSSEVFKMYALKLFYASSFGCADEDAIALHDDFKIWSLPNEFLVLPLARE